MKHTLKFAAFFAASALALSLAPTALQTSAAGSWTLSGNVADKGSVNYGTADNPRYGNLFEGDGAFSLGSDKKIWANKFGVSYRIRREGTDGIVLAVSSERDKDYREAAGSFSVALAPTDAQMTQTSVTVFAGEEQIARFDSNVLYWDDEHVYSTNNVHLAKGKEGWIVNLNDSETTLSEEASARCEEELKAFEDKIGYLQLYNGGGKAGITFVSALYGAPAETISEKPDRFVNGPIFDEPTWTVTSGDEIAGFTSAGGAQYAIQGSDLLPFNGFEYTLRAAHGDDTTNFHFAFTSLYQQNWYAGTYTVCLIVKWNAGASDDTAAIDFLRYTPTTDPSGEEPVKLTQNDAPFRWFRSNTFRIVREHGDFKIYLNGQELFAGMTDAGGRSASDYLSEVEPYYENGAGYVQFWYNAGRAGDSFVVERAKVADPNAVPTCDREYASAVSSVRYRVGETVRLDLGKLFLDGDGDELHYFATKGTVKDGVWEYTASMPGSLFVTFTGSDRYGGESIRLMFEFGDAQGGGGCAAAAGTALFPLLLVLLCVPALIGRKTDRKGERK